MITATPASVCIGDNFKTHVTLDSLGSSPTLTLVYASPDPDAGTLVYSWSLSGAVCKGLSSDPTTCDVIVDGSDVDVNGTIFTPTVQVTLAGDLPVFVTLTVTVQYADQTFGPSASIQGEIPLTPLDSAGRCPLTPGP